MTSYEDHELIQHQLEEKAEKYRALAAQPDVYATLARSLAPSIWEMEDEKKGLLLQLFGGRAKVLKKGGDSRFRYVLKVRHGTHESLLTGLVGVISISSCRVTLV